MSVLKGVDAMEAQSLPARTQYKTERIAGLELGSPGQRGDLNVVFDMFHLGLLRGLARPIAAHFACDPRWTHHGLLWAIQAHHDELDRDITFNVSSG